MSTTASWRGAAGGGESTPSGRGGGLRAADLPAAEAMGGVVMVAGLATFPCSGTQCPSMLARYTTHFQLMMAYDTVYLITHPLTSNRTNTIGF